MNVTAWSNGLEVTGGGTGVVSHAGLGLVRRLADKTGLTGGLSRALWSGRVLGHDRGRVLADISCVIADGARAISDFRVLADQKEAFGQVASVPTAYRTLEEIAQGGTRTARKLTAAVNAARRHAWAQAVARHGKLPGVRVADKVLAGVTCIRLDATVTFAHSDKELAEANFKGYGHHPLLAYCDNTGGEPLAVDAAPRLGGEQHGRGSPGRSLDAAIAAMPPAFRRKLMVTSTAPGQPQAPASTWTRWPPAAGTSSSTRCGWELGEREKTALRLVPEGRPGRSRWITAARSASAAPMTPAPVPAAAHRACWIEEAHVTELTGLLRDEPGRGPARGWPAAMRVFARRERPHPGAQLTLFESRRRLAVPACGSPTCPATTQGWRGPDRLHRRRPPGPRPGRGRDPHRQRHRDGPLPVLYL